MPRNGGDAGNNGGCSGSSAATSDGCIYPDDVILEKGVTFNVRYTGCVEVKTSMKSLDFETRTQLARWVMEKKQNVVRIWNILNVYLLLQWVYQSRLRGSWLEVCQQAAPGQEVIQLHIGSSKHATCWHQHHNQCLQSCVDPQQCGDGRNYCQSQYAADFICIRWR